MTDKSREEFVAWSSAHSFLGGCYLKTQSDGTYIDVDLQYAWEAWQASRAALVVELPKQSPYANTFGDYAKGYRQASRDHQDAIEDTGLKVKS